MTEEIRKWWFTKKIEDMPLEELADRIKKVMEVDLKKKIVTIPYVGEDEVVEYKTDELVGLCPATGYPDYYTLIVRFVPDKLLPELKSFKFYLMEYRELPISHEHLAEKIYQDFKEVVKPKTLYVELWVARRGGIDTKIYKGDVRLASPLTFPSSVRAERGGEQQTFSLLEGFEEWSLFGNLMKVKKE